jgi:hypothetical protein
MTNEMRSQNRQSFAKNQDSMVKGLLEIAWYGFWFVAGYIWPAQDPRNVMHEDLSMVCDVDFQLIQGSYLMFVLIMCPMRLYFHRLPRDTNPAKVEKLNLFINVFHCLMSFSITVIFSAATFGKDYGACLSPPLRVIALNSLLILMVVLAEALVVSCMIIAIVICCPFVTVAVF